MLLDQVFNYQEVISLSFDETNKLREKLGLKPLNVTAAGAPTEVLEIVNFARKLTSRY